jgi:hypothetical protein
VFVLFVCEGKILFYFSFPKDRERDVDGRVGN